MGLLRWRREHLKTRRSRRAFDCALAVGCLVVIVIAVVCIVPWLLFRPRTILSESHQDPHFSLYVSEATLLGPNYAVETGSRIPFLRSKVAQVFEGDWFDTPNLDADSFGFEWHEERDRVALRGSEGYGETIYVLLLEYDSDGHVAEIPVEVQLTHAWGDSWGSVERCVRHHLISGILADSGPRPDDDVAALELKCGH